MSIGPERGQMPAEIRCIDMARLPSGRAVHGPRDGPHHKEEEAQDDRDAHGSVSSGIDHQIIMRTGGVIDGMSR